MLMTSTPTSSPRLTKPNPALPCHAQPYQAMPGRARPRQKTLLRRLPMAKLKAAQRQAMPSSSFALPGKGEGKSGKGAGSYPIPDRSHARNALSRVSQHGSSTEKAKVRAKVHAKFPDIGKGKD